MKNNQLLMLKQGIKGVFSFKIQFSIILLLTFLASVILTVSTTTNRRLMHSYNDIVASAQKFDNTWSLNTGRNQRTDKEKIFVPILDTVGLNNSYVYADDISDYNIVLNKSVANGSVNNYITNTVENSNEFYQKFVALFNATNLAHPSSPNANQQAYKEKLELTSVLAKQFFTDLLDYKRLLLTDLQTWTDNDYKKYDDIKYLMQTSFGIYTKKYIEQNPDQELWFEKYTIDTDYIYSKQQADTNEVKEKERVWDKLNKDKDKNYINAQFTGYVYFAIQSLVERLSFIIATEKDKFADGTKEDKSQLMYEYIFGTSGKLPTKNSKFIGGYKSSIDKWLSIDDIKKDKVNKYIVLSENIAPGNEPYVFKDIDGQFNQMGLRGNTNFVINHLNSNNKLHRSKDNPFKSGYNELQTFATSSYMGSTFFKNNFVKYFSIFQPEDDWMYPHYLKNPEGSIEQFFWYEGTFESNTLDFEQKRGSAFLAHQKLTSAATDFDLYIRREILYSDAATQKKYRAIILQDGQQTTFKILKGRAPSSLGEIAISGQFAKRNKVDIGQYIKIGNGLFYISGFAVDTYSFYPSADPLVPLPKAETDGLIYASPSTLKLLSQNLETESSVATEVTQTFNFINLPDADNIDESILNEQRNKYVILSNSAKKYAKQNVDLWNGQTRTNNKVEAEAYFDFQTFDQSNYKLSWTLYHLVFWVYSSITYVTAFLIGLIAVASLIVCVRKTIQANAKQIGILKAMGTESSQISISYVAYSFFIAFGAVPLGWIVGTFMQIPMMNIFANYFSFPTNEIFFDWIGPLIAVLGFGLLAAFVGFITAYLETNKPVLDITANKNKWTSSKTLDYLKRTMFKKSSFNFCLSLQLASSGKKTIGLLSATVFVSSFFISLGLAIPAVALNAKDQYFANTRFRNSVTLQNPTGNSPFSKDGVTFWNGQQPLDKDYNGKNRINLDGTTKGNGYYENPNNYISSNVNSSIVPALQYIKPKNVRSTSENKPEIQTIFQNGLEKRIDITNSFISAAGNALPSEQGVGFSIGTVEQFYAYALNVKRLCDSNGNVLIDEKTTDAERIAIASKAVGSITPALPKILSALIESWNENAPIDSTWKDQLVGMLTSYAPSFVKPYLSSESRYEQFSLGFGTSTYVPKHETYATMIDAQTSKHGKITLTGLDHNQNAFKVTDKVKGSVFFKNNLEGQRIKLNVQQILSGEQLTTEDGIVIDQDIWYQGIKIWDNQNQILTLPVANNNQSNAYYSMSEGSEYKNMATSTTALKLFSRATGKNEALPVGAWAYNDTDYIQALKNGYAQNGQEEDAKQSPRTLLNEYGYETIGDNHYLNPSNMQTSKMTYNLQYDVNEDQKATSTDYTNDGLFDGSKWSGIKDKAYMFGDFKYDTQGKIIGSFIRPYYQYKNVELYIPVQFAIGKDGTEYQDGPVSLANYQNKSANEVHNSPSDSITYKDPITNYLTEGLGNKYKNTSWFVDQAARVINKNKVPVSVKKAWELQGKLNGKNYDNTKYIVVNAYDPRFASMPNQMGKPALSHGIHDGSELSAVTDGYAQWSTNARKSGFISHDDSAPGPRGLAREINLQVVGTIETYDSKLIVIDSDLANMLKGWPTTRTSAYDYSGFDLSNPVKHSKSQFTTYDMVDFTKRKAINDNWQNTAFVKDVNSQDYNPHGYFNAIYSNYEEPLAVTSTTSMVKTGGKDGMTSIANGDAGAQESGFTSFNFLAEQISLLKQITSVSIYVAALIVSAVAIAAALLIMLVGDIYIAQYKRFIVMLRAFGYSNVSIMGFVLGTVSVISVFMWTLATALIWGSIALTINLVAKAGFAIPFGFQWWAPVLCIGIMLVSYIGSLMVSSRSARKEPASTMMTSTAE